MIKYKKNFENEYFIFFISLFCFVITPVFSLIINIYLLFKVQKKWISIFIVLMISLTLGYLAYHTIPLESDDLFRHYENMNLLKNIPFEDIFNASYPGVYLNTLIMYLISLTSDNNIYAFLYVFLGFFILIHIYLNYAKKEGVSFLIFLYALIFVFLVMFPRFYISGLRNHFAFLISFSIIYKNYILKREDKIIDLLIFVIACLIHTSVIFIAICYYFNKLTYTSNIIRKFRKSLILIILILPVLVRAIVLLLPKEIILLLSQNDILSKVIYYIAEGTFIPSINAYVLCLAIVFFAVFCFFLCKKTIEKDENKKYLSFFALLLLLSVSFMFFNTILIRFIYFISFTQGLLIISLLKNKDNIKVKRTVLLFSFLIIIGCVLYNAASLSSYPWLFDKETWDLLFLI